LDPPQQTALRSLAKQGAAQDARKLRFIKGFVMPVDTQAATDRLMRFLAVEGVTGKEAAIGRELSAALKESGVPADAIRLDDANTRIPVPTETGNLIVDLPGRGAMHNRPRIMFMTHMDTVPLCAGARPKLVGRKIVNEAKTALGGDNRAGCGVLVTVAAELVKQKLDVPNAVNIS
jgi:tripeptide aminopeptidase